MVPVFRHDSSWWLYWPKHSLSVVWDHSSDSYCAALGEPRRGLGFGACSPSPCYFVPGIRAVTYRWCRQPCRVTTSSLSDVDRDHASTSGRSLCCLLSRILPFFFLALKRGLLLEGFPPESFRDMLSLAWTGLQQWTFGPFSLRCIWECPHESVPVTN